MTVPEKLWQLAERLLKKTRDGSVKWETTADKGVFQTSFPKFSVAVREIWVYGQDEPDYTITVYGEDGDPIESATDAELRNSVAELENSRMAFHTMRELFNSARRSATGVNEALDELLAELDEAGAA